MSRLKQRTLVLVILCGLAVAQRSFKYNGGPGGVAFREPNSENSGRNNKLPAEVARKLDGASELAKRVDLARRISSVRSEQEFVKLMRDLSTPVIYPNNNGTIAMYAYPNLDEGFDVIQRSNFDEVEPAMCKPELQSVCIVNESDSSTYYFPPCVRINRCGGCCSDRTLLTCQPVTREPQNVKVWKSTIGDGRVEQTSVTVEKHTKCRCECKIKEEHCNQKQSYVPQECICVCNNVDEEEKCLRDHTKIWDHGDCTCNCLRIEECSTGLHFDPSTCRCQKSTTRIGGGLRIPNYSYGQTQRPDSEPMFVTLLDAGDPRRKPKPDPE